MSAVHDFADRLLDLAYGELPPPEAKELEAHVRGCSQCSNALDDIRGVRRVMGQLPPAAEPDMGLESLMAYADQAARRASAGPEPKGAGWRRWLAPVLGLTAVAALGAVTFTSMLGGGSPAPSASELLASEKAAVKVEPVAMVAPAEEAPPPPLDLRKAAQLKDQEEAQQREAEVAENKLRDEGARKQAAVIPATGNSANFDGKVAGMQNSIPLGKDLNRGGPGVGDIAGGEGSGGYLAEKKSGSSGASLEDSVAFGKGGGKKEEAKPDLDSLASASTRSNDRNDPTVKTPAPKRQEVKTEDFPAWDAPAADKAKDKKAAEEIDVAYAESKSRGRAESKNDEAPVMPAPMAMSPPAERSKVAETDDSYEQEKAAVVAESPAKKSKSAAEDPNIAELKRLLALAQSARNAGNRSLEAQYLRQAAVLPVRNPVHANALLMLGEVEYALGNYPAGDAAYRNAMALYPSTGISQSASRKLNDSQQQQKTGNPYAPGQHRPADMPKESPSKSAVDSAAESY